MSDESNKFAVGQLVAYMVDEYDTEDCPHCGQEMERHIGSTFVTSRVLEVDASHYPDGKGGTYAKYGYRLGDGWYGGEAHLEAVE